MNTKEDLVAGLDYEVAILRRVQRGRGTGHVTSTGDGETNVYHVSIYVYEIRPFTRQNCSSEPDDDELD